MRRFWFGLIILLLTAMPARAEESEMFQKEVPHFGQVAENLYRGAQPTPEGLRLLKEKGIRTIINFRHEPKPAERERQRAEALGLRYIHLPWRIQKHPETPAMQSFLDEVSAPENGPFFMHCRRGSERTGVASALYYIWKDGLDRETALARATEGYPVLFYWKPFIKWRLEDFLKDLNLAAKSDNPAV
jgi:Uncharacterized protein conserved in bacteria